MSERYYWEYSQLHNRYFVFDKKRGSPARNQTPVDRAMAVCRTADDAEAIAEALNKASRP